MDDAISCSGIHQHEAFDQRCDEEAGGDELGEHHVQCQATHQSKILKTFGAKRHESLTLQGDLWSCQQAHDRGQVQGRRETISIGRDIHHDFDVDEGDD